MLKDPYLQNKNEKNITRLILLLHTYKNGKVFLIYSQSQTLAEAFLKTISSPGTALTSDFETIFSIRSKYYK